MPDGENERRVPVDPGEAQAKTIVFAPPQPTSPAETGLSWDARKLGVRDIRLRLEQERLKFRGLGGSVCAGEGDDYRRANKTR